MSTTDPTDRSQAGDRPKCAVPGCDRPTRSRNGIYCRAHQQQVDVYGYDAPRPIRVARAGCTVDGCDGAHYAAGKCKPHYHKFYMLERQRKRAVHGPA